MYKFRILNITFNEACSLDYFVYVKSYSNSKFCSKLAAYVEVGNIHYEETSQFFKLRYYH